MKLVKSACCVAAAGLALGVGGASASVLTTITFDNFKAGTGPDGGNPSQNVFTFDEVNDGVTMTASTVVTPADINPQFSSNANGAGINTAFGSGSAPRDGTGGQSFTQFNIDSYESFSLTFSGADGTFDSVLISNVNNPGTDSDGTIVITNETTSESVVFNDIDAAGAAVDATITVDLDFTSGDVFTFTHTGAATYRISETVITVPEPGSFLLAGVGGALMLVRRRCVS